MLFWPRARKSAQQVKAMYYDTGLPCKHGHLSLRFTSNGSCVQCNSDWKLDNAEKYRTSTNTASKRWQRNNPEYVARNQKRWQQKNQDKLKSNNEKYLANVSQLAELYIKFVRKHAQITNHPHYHLLGAHYRPRLTCTPAEFYRQLGPGVVKLQLIDANAKKLYHHTNITGTP